jgi:hypothetical protein
MDPVWGTTCRENVTGVLSCSASGKGIVVPAANVVSREMGSCRYRPGSTALRTFFSRYPTRNEASARSNEHAVVLGTQATPNGEAKKVSSASVQAGWVHTGSRDTPGVLLVSRYSKSHIISGSLDTPAASRA